MQLALAIDERFPSNCGHKVKTPTFLLLSVRWNHFSIDPEIEWPKSFLAINIFMNFWFCALSWVRFSLGHSHSKSQLINLACCKSLISFDFVLYIKL